MSAVRDAKVWTRVWLSAVGLALLMTACGTPSRSAQLPGLNATSTSTAVAPPGTCAGVADALLAPSAVGQDMIITSKANFPGPVGSTVIAPDASPSPSAFVWVEDENLTWSTLPQGFVFTSPSAAAKEYPDQILVVGEAVQTMTSVQAAIQSVDQALANANPPEYAPEQFPVNGTLFSVSHSVATNVGIGDQAHAEVNSLASISLPTSVLYVVREGSTIIDLSVWGGVDISASSVLPLVNAAVSKLNSACPNLG